jgi:hypothetical protein
VNELVSVDAGLDDMQRAVGDTPAAHQVAGSS